MPSDVEALVDSSRLFQAFMAAGITLWKHVSLIKPPPGSHQIERISQTKNRTGLLAWATHQQTIYKSLLINIRLYQYHINFMTF